MDTAEVGGQPALTHFAADFTVQFVTSSFEQTVDPATGGIILGQVLTPIPGDWYAVSLRYQSDVPAFAFLSPVPEPGGGILTALGLALVMTRMRRRKSARLKFLPQRLT